MWRSPLCLLLLLSLSCAGPISDKPASVVLVTIDTLRADHLGSYGGKLPTPHLDRLAGEGTRFADAIAHSPLTLPSHSSILTGTYPTYHGVRDNGRFRLPDQIDTLAEMLKEAGYSTAAFVGGFPVHSRFGLDQGFEHYDERFNRSPAALAFAERRAEDVVDAATEWIRDAESTLYFVWIHLFDPHAPYEPPEPFLSEFADRYAGEVAYMDHALESLFSALGDDVLTIVTADHGEGLGEHGESTHGLFVYDSTIKVPLLFRGPRVPRGAVIRDPVRTIDILPSILELVGERDACAACQGQSLVGLMRGREEEPRASYAETYFPRLNLGWSELRSLRQRGWKYIAAPEPELYDLASEPGEIENLALKRPKKLQELAAELSALERSITGSLGATSGTRPDRKTLSVLRSLGYLSAGKAPSREGPLPDPKSNLAVWQKCRHGMERAARGEFDQAIIEFEAVLQQDAKLLLAQSYLAGAYFERGRYGDAAEQSAKILAADPAHFEAALVLGRSLLQLGRLGVAEEALQEAARLDSRSAVPLAVLANLHLKQGAPGKARKLLADARQREASSSAVLLVQGKLLMIEGREQQAEDSFRRALSAAPSEEEPRVQLANLLLGKRRLSEAEHLIREGLAQRPQSASLHLGLGHSLALAGKMTEAIQTFEEALKLAPDSTLVMNSLGFAYLEIDEVEKGLALLDRSLKTKSDQPELRSFLESLRGS